ncbi:MAG: tRNA (N(6)-L-threonylcarbamoyladenosine(37)-C(2))-methylthiotransferase MtaB [Firmicutes bacterium]|nr:tRNA (N(6)-L-threonylcarbamoyladenosine(37)-C(2))-methylthiotransferase MtaB [Bacillota bacterium]
MSINKLKVAFHTLGCKVNQYETEAMKEQFRAAGCTVVGEEDTADVYVINTCTVTNLADRKSRQYIRRMKKKCPEAVIAVTGCYAQVKPEEVSALEEADIVAGTGEKNNILSYVQQFMEERQRQTHIKSYDELTGYDDKGVITSMESRTRAYIKIQEGCDRFCSYCLIPFARGHVRSRNPEEITEEAETLIRQGFKEIILTGINTALYGAEENFSYPLKPDEEAAGMRGIEIIIKRINDLEGDFRIRLSSLEPTVINAAYVRELMKYDKLCHHLHLSVQSGSNRVLKLMNRRYDRSEYLEIVKVLREFDPLYGITTDIICGFPGETDKDFEDSLDIIEQVKFCKVHAFRYSKRRGTAAALMEGQVSGEVKKRRSDRLIEAGEKAAAEFMESCRNSVRPVLFEEVCGTLVAGYSDNYIKVYAEGGEDDLNRIRNVKLSENYKDGMKGEIE